MVGGRWVVGGGWWVVGGGWAVGGGWSEVLAAGWRAAGVWLVVVGGLAIWCLWVSRSWRRRGWVVAGDGWRLVVAVSGKSWLVVDGW